MICSIIRTDFGISRKSERRARSGVARPMGKAAARNGRQRAKFFDDSRGSAIECAACLDASVAKRFVSKDRIRPGKEMLSRIVAMLTRLVDRFDTDEIRLRADSSPSWQSFP